MEENVLFKNTSKLDYEEITILQNFANKKVVFITSIIFALVFAGIGAGLSFVNLTLGIIIIACGLLGAFVLVPYLMKESIKKANKESLGDKKYLNDYQFFEEYFEVESQASNLNENNFEKVGSQKIYYKDLYQVVVYQQHLFIFINVRQSFILNFKGMTKGTAGELIEKLKSTKVLVKDKTAK